MKKKTIYILTFLIILFYTCNYASAEEKYSPYPIVFVHGFGGSYIGTWGDTLSYFQQNYFEGKYFIDDCSCLFPPYDYSPANMDLLEYPVAKLKAAIDRGINKGFPQDYRGERKVIVVGHSMGGLVVRAFLKKYSLYQNKISRVLFVGTPHKGSPLASAYSLVNEEAKK